MAALQDDRPIYIKRIPPPPPPGHGGAWKVAYADFVTAMMAFFLLLWILNATTVEQRQGISNFFEPVGAIKGSSGSGGVFGGISATEPGSEEKPGETPQLTLGTQAEVENELERQSKIAKKSDTAKTAVPRDIRDEEAQFEAARKTIKKILEELPELAELKDSVLIDVADEGLRIQLVDQDRMAMYASGSARLNPRGERLLRLVAEVIERLPHKIAIAGHTDATPFRDGSGRTNWELSLDRANASRRALVRFGIPEERIATVVGKADKEPLDKEDPYSPRNRRISIVLLREQPKKGLREIPEPPRIFGG